MKKRWILLLCAALVLCLAGCGRNEPEETAVITEFTEVTEPEVTTAVTVPAADPETIPAQELSEAQIRRLSAFRQVMEHFYYEHTAPDLSLIHQDESFGPMEKNTFTLADVDGDGAEELILFNTTECMAGMCAWVLGYDDAQDAITCRLTEFPALDFYTGGLAVAEASHNQGLSGDVVWPYTLYGFNPASRTYTPICSVEAWDRNLAETDFEGNEFPAEADTDGAGYVFFLRTPGKDEPEILSASAYESWKASVFGSSRPIELTMQNITPDTIYGICPD